MKSSLCSSVVAFFLVEWKSLRKFRREKGDTAVVGAVEQARKQ